MQSGQLFGAFLGKSASAINGAIQRKMCKR